VKGVGVVNKIMREVFMMDNKDTNALYKSAMKKWGGHSQILMCVEDFHRYDYRPNYSSFQHGLIYLGSMVRAKNY